MTANLSIVYFGPQAAIWNAFIFIGFDLTARDGLHEAWQGGRLWPKMLVLIAAGSVISWLLNVGAGIIALASFMAFFGAGIADALIYWAFGSKSRLLKMNGSNTAGAMVDSFVFVAIAGLPWVIVPGQVLAKILGGFFWSLMFYRKG